MKNFQKKKSFRDVMQTKPALVILGLLVLFLIWTVFGLVGKVIETSQNRRNAEEKITELQRKKEQLLSDISKLNTDKGVEENIREKFGLAKEGEGMVVVVEDKKSAEMVNENKPNAFITFLKNWFK